MPPTVTVDILDRMRPNLASLVMERAKRLPGMVYCDLRLQVKEEKSAVAENGKPRPAARIMCSISACGSLPEPG